MVPLRDRADHQEAEPRRARRVSSRFSPPRPGTEASSPRSLLRERPQGLRVKARAWRCAELAASSLLRVAEAKARPRPAIFGARSMRAFRVGMPVSGQRSATGDLRFPGIARHRGLENISLGAERLAPGVGAATPLQRRELHAPAATAQAADSRAAPSLARARSPTLPKLSPARGSKLTSSTATSARITTRRLRQARPLALRSQAHAGCLSSGAADAARAIAAGNSRALL